MRHSIRTLAQLEWRNTKQSPIPQAIWVGYSGRFVGG